MDSTEVSALVEKGLEDCRVSVEGGGGRFEVTVVGDCFDGLMPVRRQKLVYATLADVIATGEVHAVTIRAHTPQEWTARGAPDAT